MMSRRRLVLGGLGGLSLAAVLTWNVGARAAYESAPYEVTEKDGMIEIREYPDLVLASTSSRPDAQGRDGSFMRLFRYISGDNEARQKIEMTTPVFMQAGAARTAGSMGFVMPRKVAADGAPKPAGQGVQIQTRSGGRFAVIRFSGRMSAKLAKEHHEKLSRWLEERGYEAAETYETAGYDAPFTPGPLRRNEVLIRLVKGAEDGVSASPQNK